MSTLKLPSQPYFDDNAIKQILKIAAAHDISVDIDFGTVTIYTGKTPSDSVVPYISPEHWAYWVSNFL
jgi:hypothetical protein